MNEKKVKQSFSEEFKSQLLQLYNSGKPKVDICRKYQIQLTVLPAEVFLEICLRTGLEPLACPHRFEPYFKLEKKMINWLKRSEKR